MLRKLYLVPIFLSLASLLCVPGFAYAQRGGGHGGGGHGGGGHGGGGHAMSGGGHGGGYYTAAAITAAAVITAVIAAATGTAWPMATAAMDWAASVTA